VSAAPVTAGPERALVHAWLAGWAAEVALRRAWLTELDAAIGDGDHGINLDRGLALVVEDLRDVAPDGTAGRDLAAAGRRLLGTVGGASGALYGKALLRAGAALDAVPAPVDAAALGTTTLTAAVVAITALGKAAPGDKTMLDALLPAVEALRTPAAGAGPCGRLARAAGAAWAGAEATVPLVARKGRASYLGERSRGHRDPGAVSAAMLVDALARACPDAAGHDPDAGAPAARP
jgi:dihydroxyacetone kinase-like protein